METVLSIQQIGCAEAALAIMRDLYVASFEALEAQKKLNKALIAGLLG